MFSKLISLLVAPAVFGIKLQLYQQGLCEQVNLGRPFFEMDRFLGEWVEHYRFVLPDNQEDCVKNYYWAFNGTFYNLTETKTNIASGRNTSSTFSLLGRPGVNINLAEFNIQGSELLRPTIQDDRCIGIFPITTTTVAPTSPTVAPTTPTVAPATPTVAPTSPGGASTIMVPSVLALLILKAFQMFV